MKRWEKRTKLQVSEEEARKNVPRNTRGNMKTYSPEYDIWLKAYFELKGFNEESEAIYKAMCRPLWDEMMGLSI